MKSSIKKIIYSFVLVLAFGAVFSGGVFYGAEKFSYHPAVQPGTIDFSLFWDAYNKLQENFIEPQKIDSQKIVYGAIQGMTKSLGDPYTDFFDPKEAKLFQQGLAGSFSGIGAEIGIKQEQLTIIAPLPETPGQKAGLKSGDMILKINGQSTENMSTEEAVNLIRGPKGTDVVLNIFRNGWNAAKDIKITRDTINVPTMSWEIKNENIAYIRIHQFGETLSQDFRAAAAKILQSPAKKIILDLRGNPGGYLETAQDIAGWFLKKDKTVIIESFGDKKEEKIYKAEGGSDFANYPMVILIDGGSASASEILAGALRDNRNIKLIGTKSFGKGSVQEVVNMHGGSFLKITIAKWLTPKGASISEVGLTPDIKVEITDKDIEQNKDPQLDKALEIVNSLK